MYHEHPLASETWVALAIGNSRLHWAQFAGDELQQTWDTPHLTAAEAQQLVTTQLIQQTTLYIASVVPQQSQLWQDYPSVHFITLEDVPLQGLYATLGIDRALALLGAIATLGSPVLVLDAGTALTVTGADQTHQLMGGAILPGLGLQLRSLKQSTAALPLVQPSDAVTLPSRWATTTTDAIVSGIVYTLLAGLREFVEAWRQEFPESLVVLTGGDGDRLHAYLTAYAPALASNVTVEPHLIFWGLRSVREESLKAEV